MRNSGNWHWRGTVQCHRRGRFGGPAKRPSRRRGRRAGGFLRRPLGGPLQAAAAGEWPVHPARAALTRPALFPFRFPLSLLIVVAELESGVRTSDPARRSRQCFPDVFISMVLNCQEGEACLRDLPLILWRFSQLRSEGFENGVRLESTASFGEQGTSVVLSARLPLSGTAPTCSRTVGLRELFRERCVFLFF